MKKAKYIIISTTQEVTGMAIFTFPEFQSHAEVLKMTGQPREAVVSAAFYSFDRTGHYVCFGSSDSIGGDKAKAHPGDNLILQAFFPCHTVTDEISNPLHPS